MYGCIPKVGLAAQEDKNGHFNFQSLRVFFRLLLLEASNLNCLQFVSVSLTHSLPSPNFKVF